MTLPRVYPILDRGLLEAKGCPLIVAAAGLLAGGAEILQLRHKDHWSRATFAEAEEIARLCAQARATFIVNDRADMAMLLGAGLHVGQEDLEPVQARRLMGERGPIGFSTHNADQIAFAAHEPVDYVALGPIYATSSKLNPDPVVGLKNLQEWRKLVPQPLVAIGGITRENARAVFDVGADSVAIIADLLPAVCTESSMRVRMNEWLQLTRT
ncbi:MAG: thiamine phosphate synthase [Acidobacteriota bacterium]|nr:thiamine phosphate synthase [Acidobacteriota bacterium]